MNGPYVTPPVFGGVPVSRPVDGLIDNHAGLPVVIDQMRGRVPPKASTNTGVEGVPPEAP